MRSVHEWRFYGGAGRIERKLGGSFETTNGTMLREAAIAGIGLVILPRFMIHDAVARSELETVLSAFAPQPLGTVLLLALGVRALRGVARSSTTESPRTSSR